MKRAAVTALVVLLGLTGCQSAREACEADGGAYTQTGTATYTTFISSGKVLVPIISTVPVYECEAADR